MRKILPCIVTTYNSQWKEKLEKTKLKEVAVFLSCLEKKQRKEFYNLLEKSSIKSIPLIHLRGDMETKELDYLVNNYQIKVFNIHSQKEYPILYDYSKHKNIIYLENTYSFLTVKELNNFAGICLDLTHLENDRILNSERFEQHKKIIKNYKIGCNHISCVKKTPRKDEKGFLRYDYHYLEKLSELDYLKNYPLNYFSDFIAIELENDLKEQLEIKKYIQTICK